MVALTKHAPSPGRFVFAVPRQVFRWTPSYCGRHSANVLGGGSWSGVDPPAIIQRAGELDKIRLQEAEWACVTARFSTLD